LLSPAALFMLSIVGSLLLHLISRHSLAGRSPVVYSSFFGPQVYPNTAAADGLSPRTHNGKSIGSLRGRRVVHPSQTVCMAKALLRSLR
jgi:hypothetical protein